MEKIIIYSDSLKGFYDCNPGTTLLELSQTIFSGCKFPVLAALVDNELKDLNFKIYSSHTIKFLDYTHPDGKRTYTRSLSFILQKAVVDLFPEYTLSLDYTLPNGLYGELRHKCSNVDVLQRGIKLSMDDIVRIKRKMNELIVAKIPIVKKKAQNSEAVSIFTKNGQYDKASLVHNMDKFFVSVYYIGDYADTFYGPMLTSTEMITLFDIIPYGDGFCLQAPSPYNPNKITEYIYQDKLSKVFKENSNWCSIIGAHGISSVNKEIINGHAKEMIQVAESLHERKFVFIADKIHERRDKLKLVLISGPSSSGKTTTSKRIALQCKVMGLNPVVIAMDNYFVNRELTPKDENGDYDFESINALDLPFFNSQLNDMFEGKQVELPKFNFIEGKRYFDGTKIKLSERDILIMEGIHALNPLLTNHIDNDRVYKIFASALTSLSIDENNYISTTDNRLLRRIVRDNLTRGVTPEETILRWPSVRKGEENNIFPFQENSDVMFNSALLFELPLLKYYIEPLLSRINPLSVVYPERVRLLKFLSYVTALSPEEIKCIPPTSIMREFIGGSTFNY